MESSVNRYRAFGILLVLGTILTLIATWNLHEAERNEGRQL